MLGSWLWILGRFGYSGHFFSGFRTSAPGKGSVQVHRRFRFLEVKLLGGFSKLGCLEISECSVLSVQDFQSLGLAALHAFGRVPVGCIPLPSFSGVGDSNASPAREPGSVMATANSP